MTRPVYMTARCTRGCEFWGPPEVVARHVHERRCRAVALFRRPLETVLIPAKYAKLLEHSVAGHLMEPKPAARGDSHESQSYRPYAVHAGAALRSPIEGVPPRVWWLVVKPYLDADIPPDQVLDLALDADSFLNLMPEEHLESFATCPKCGEVVVHLMRHQRTSRRCRTAAAANQVLELWAEGYRDPWTATERPPLSWGQLQIVRWKRRLVVVEFPQYNAVLVAPTLLDPEPRRSPQTRSGARAGP